VSYNPGAIKIYSIRQVGKKRANKILILMQKSLKVSAVKNQSA